MEYWYKAKVVSVYDGDTITVDIDLGFNMIMKKRKIRLAGIDTPELRGEERPQGLIVKKWLSDKILGKEIKINTVKDKTGKYGRYLAYIYFENENLNETLLNNNMAEPYL